MSLIVFFTVYLLYMFIKLNTNILFGRVHARIWILELYMFLTELQYFGPANIFVQGKKFDQKHYRKEMSSKTLLLREYLVNE